MTGLEPLIIAWLVSRYLVRNFWQDGLHAWRGEDPPSFRREQERFKARQAKGEGPDPHRAAKRYFANAWNDAFETAEESRARRRAKRLKERHERWAAEDENERAWDGDGIGEVDETRPTTEPEHSDGLCWFCDKEAATTNCNNNAGMVRPACAKCAAARELPPLENAPEPEPLPEVPESADVPSEDGAAPDDDQPYEVVDPDPADPPSGGKVIQFPTMNATTKEEPMSEIAGLRAAITYTKESADKATEAAQGIELAISGLTAGGTSGLAITELQNAREALNLAAARFMSSHDELVRHLAVAEQYEANQGAGEKAFVTNN